MIHRGFATSASPQNPRRLVCNMKNTDATNNILYNNLASENKILRVYEPWNLIPQLELKEGHNKSRIRIIDNSILVIF